MNGNVVLVRNASWRRALEALRKASADLESGTLVSQPSIRSGWLERGDQVETDDRFADLDAYRQEREHG